MPPRTEQELLDATIDLATHCRWSVHHDRPARRSGARWATAIQGHAGFPDLVLARRGVVLFRELKGYGKNGRIGRLSSEQRDWARQLDVAGTSWTGLYDLPLIDSPNVPGGHMMPLFAVWTPDDWDPVIVPTLTTRARSAA